MRQVSKFARSPQGRKALTEAKRLAKDPKTRRQIDDVRRRLATKGRKP
jgi:hypothetical protein